MIIARRDKFSEGVHTKLGHRHSILGRSHDKINTINNRGTRSSFPTINVDASDGGDGAYLSQKEGDDDAIAAYLG